MLQRARGLALVVKVLRVLNVAWLLVRRGATVRAVLLALSVIVAKVSRAARVRAVHPIVAVITKAGSVPARAMQRAILRAVMNAEHPHIPERFCFRRAIEPLLLEFLETVPAVHEHEIVWLVGIA